MYHRILTVILICFVGASFIERSDLKYPECRHKPIASLDDICYKFILFFSINGVMLLFDWYDRQNDSFLQARECNDESTPQRACVTSVCIQTERKASKAMIITARFFRQLHLVKTVKISR